MLTGDMENSELELGEAAGDAVIKILLSFSDWESVLIGSYSYLRLLQARFEPSKKEQGLIDRALITREESGFPFWDCVMAEISKSEEQTPDLFHQATVHPDLGPSLRWIKRDEIASCVLNNHLEKQSDLGLETCITSEFKMSSGKTLHLPMMDFHCRPGKAGLNSAVQVCRRIFDNGFVLLESGESYHAYGRELVTSEELREFLGLSLLFAPIVDRAYIAHQLIEGRCALRLSSVKKTLPRVCEIETLS